jgi:hypothetical protein
MHFPMSNILYLQQIKAALRPLGFMLIICAVMFQFVAPAVAAPAKGSAPEHHMMMDHSKMAHSGVAGMNKDMPETNVHHQDATHCMAFMCCFHEASAPFKLVASDVLLPGDIGLEHTMILTSYFQTSKDRPPQHI